MTDNQIEMRERSPRAPFISLRKAMERASEFYTEHTRHAVRINSAAASWGYGEKSSGGRQTVATLIMYGILQDSGSGSDRKVQITEAAFRYLADEREEQRFAVLAQLALTPKILSQLWDDWGPAPPGDAECRSHLRIDLGFTEAAAQDLLAIYKDNISFARLDLSDKVPSNAVLPQKEPQMMPIIQSTQQGSSQPSPVVMENLGENDIKVMLDGDRLRVSAYVDAKGAKRLMKALKANIELLSDDDGEEGR